MKSVGIGHTQEARAKLDSEAVRQLTDAYLRAAAGRWEHIESGEVELPLGDLFCMPRAVEAPPPRPLAARFDLVQTPGRQEHAQAGPIEIFAPPKPVLLAEALQRARHLALLGDPGAGKSTTQQFVGLCFAHPGMAQERLGLDEPCVPVRLELRSFAEAASEAALGWTLEKALAKAVDDLLRLKDEEDALELVYAWRDEGRLLALLDGLDEAPDGLRQAARKEIRDFVASAGGAACRVIVATRLAGYQSLGSGFKEYSLKPFESGEETRPFLAAWLKALRLAGVGQASEQADTGQPDCWAQAQAAELLRQIEGQPGLRRLTDNPLLLRLAAQVFFAYGTVPANRAALYQHYLDVAWERARNLGAQDHDRTFAALEALAWRLQMHDTPVMEPGALQVAREQMGLVVQVDQGLAFSHATFQEYFVALHLLHAGANNAEWMWQFLRPRLHVAAWREPLLLLAGIVDAEDFLWLLQRVIKARSPYENYLWRDLSLAVTLIGERRELTEEGLTWVTLRAWIWDIPVIGRLVNQIWFTLNTKSLVLSDMKIIKALGAAGIVEAAGTLNDFLKSDFALVRGAAAEALGELRAPQAVEPLIQSLKDEDEGVRAAAAKALGRLGDPQALEALIQALLRDGEFNVRWEAADALGNLNCPEAVRALVQAQTDDAGAVVEAAVGALGQMSCPEAVEALLATLKSHSDYIRHAAAKALASLSHPEGINTLLNELVKAETHRGVDAAETLGRMGRPEAFKALARASSGQDRDIRFLAVTSLARLVGHPRAARLLEQALRDEDELTRRTAAGALAQLKPSELKCPDEVDAVLQEVGSEEGYTAAAKELARLGRPEALKPLLGALKDDAFIFRAEAAEGLGLLGRPEAIGPLSRALHDSHSAVRNLSAEALEKILPNIEVQSPYRDPLSQPPHRPGPRWLAPALAGAGLALLLAIAALWTIFSGLFEDALKEAWRPSVQSWVGAHPTWVTAAVVAGSAVLAAVLAGLVEWFRGYLQKRKSGG